MGTDGENISWIVNEKGFTENEIEKTQKLAFV